MWLGDELGQWVTKPFVIHRLNHRRRWRLGDEPSIVPTKFITGDKVGNGAHPRSGFRVTCFLLILIRKRKLLFRVRRRGFYLDLTSRITKLNYRITKSRLKYSIFTITAVFQITPSRHFKVEIMPSHQQTWPVTPSCQPQGGPHSLKMLPKFIKC